MRSPRLNELPVPLEGKSGWPWTDAPEPLPELMPDGSQWPKISVVTPSFKQGQFIEETIRSVMLQGFPNLEFIIIDGGSTDNTIEIIKKYEPWLSYWVSEPDRGQSHAINKGITRATGDILFWLNSDDLCLPGAFVKVVEAINQSPDSKLVIGQARIINESGEFVGTLRSQFFDWEELATNPGNSIRQISSFFSRSSFYELGDINETLQIAMDTDLLFRFTRLYTPLIIDDFVSAYRSHPGAKTSSQLLKGYQETDRERKKELKGTTLALKYRQRSSSNWLSLSESCDYSLFSTVNCLFRSLSMRPSVILKRNFWSALKKITTNKLRILRARKPK